MLLGKGMGALLLVAAGVMMGIYGSREYAARVREIESMLRCLSRMKAEISLRLTPMETIFAELGQEPGDCAAFFQYMEQSLQMQSGVPLAEHWRKYAEACFPQNRAREYFAALGSSLGCYDAEAECEAITDTQQRLQEECALARAERDSKGSLHRKLGLAGGVCAAILFL